MYSLLLTKCSYSSIDNFPSSLGNKCAIISTITIKSSFLLPKIILLESKHIIFANIKKEWLFSPTKVHDVSHSIWKFGILCCNWVISCTDTWQLQNLIESMLFDICVALGGSISIAFLISILLILSYSRFVARSIIAAVSRVSSKLSTAVTRIS